MINNTKLLVVADPNKWILFVYSLPQLNTKVDIPLWSGSVTQSGSQVLLGQCFKDEGIGSDLRRIVKVVVVWLKS